MGSSHVLHHHLYWDLALGIAGIVISFMVFLAPLPTFYRIWRRRSTEDFQAAPYVVALFSAMLMVYYALVKTGSTLILAINAFGCFIEAVYIILFLVFASRKARMTTLKLLLLLNVVAYGVIVLLTTLLLLRRRSTRLHVIGWINVGFSVAVFAAPLSVMRQVIRTRSVESLPLNLSCFLTISAVVWFAYGFLIGDPYVAAPNVLGFLLGVAQIVLYIVYRDAGGRETGKPADWDSEKGIDVVQECNLAIVEKPASSTTTIANSNAGGPEVHPIEATLPALVHSDQGEPPAAVPTG